MHSTDTGKYDNSQILFPVSFFSPVVWCPSPAHHSIRIQWHNEQQNINKVNNTSGKNDEDGRGCFPVIIIIVCCLNVVAFATSQNVCLIGLVWFGVATVKIEFASHNYSMMCLMIFQQPNNTDQISTLDREPKREQSV